MEGHPASNLMAANVVVNPRPPPNRSRIFVAAATVAPTAKLEGQQARPGRGGEDGRACGRRPGRLEERLLLALLPSQTLVAGMVMPEDVFLHQQQYPAGMKTPATLHVAGVVLGVPKEGAPPVPLSTRR